MHKIQKKTKANNTGKDTLVALNIYNTMNPNKKLFGIGRLL